MATRAFIIKQNENGSYTYIYHHWDGYPESLGMILYTFYNTESKLDEVLKLGDLSILKERLYPLDGEEHTFNNPAKDVTIAYGRDRGEQDTEAKTKNSIPTFDEAGVDYMYLFKDNKWSVKSLNNYNFIPLQLVLEMRGVLDTK